MTAPRSGTPDRDDLLVVLLARTLAQLRDRLFEDGLEGAAELVSDLADIAHDDVARRAGRARRACVISARPDAGAPRG
jgi:hypothetical protein